jgi:hypothetical protein
MTDKPKKTRRKSRETTIAGLLDWWHETRQRAQAARLAAEELASIEAMLMAVAPAALARVRTEAGLPAKAPEFTPPPPPPPVAGDTDTLLAKAHADRRLQVLIDNGDGTTTPVVP